MSNYMWCVFTYWEGNKKNGSIGKPTLGQINPDKMDRVLWSGGPSYMNIYPNMQLTVLKWYEDISVRDSGRAYWRYYLDYVPCNPQTVSAENVRSEGWISPGGKWFPCGYGEHEKLAEVITAHCYNIVESSDFLDRKGWLRMRSDGFVISRSWGSTKEVKLTEAQETLLREMMTFGWIEVNENIQKTLELYGSQQ